MGQKEKIILREREDLGPVLARADHQENAIEVNKKAFYGLPPMVQEFVLCHEVCHLKHNEWDEARTNALASELFLDRAHDAEDWAARQEFLSYLNPEGSQSNLWAEIIAGVVSLGTSIYGIIRQRNTGWYSWDKATKQANLKTMLTAAFEQARKSGSKSAADFFWKQLYAYTGKDDSLEEFLGRSDNAWVLPVIAQYEKKYGFNFYAVTPVDLTAYPLAIMAIGAVVGFVIYKIIKNQKK